jgi:hypothetical protein
MTPPITARDAAAVQRLWNERVLSDADIDRALAELAELVRQRDAAKAIIRRLAKAWPKEALRGLEDWLAERA